MESLIERAARDLLKSNYAIALTGAGMSTESGIPDFRGPNGIWTKDPEAEKRAYQTYHKFLRNPKEYWEDMLSGRSLLGDLENFKPNPGHYALTELEGMGILMSVLTQNIDGLHEKSGNKRVLEYHGSVFKLRCPSCGLRFKRDEYDLKRLALEEQLPPRCTKCGSPIKGDVVHFNEPIPSDVAHESLEEAWKCDLMLVCGTSAVVYPFAQLPRIARQRQVEQERNMESGPSFVNSEAAATIIEVNAEPTPLTAEGISDYLFQGRTAEVLPKIVEAVKELS
ncbi:MAG: NAD-dependent deacylase, partial [Dehalococcoidia bacterium]|nr:NAD-dependent deacylase [Dehalococcoidia bacterium]